MRIGGAAGFSFDSLTAVPQLLAAGVDLLIFDYMAELAVGRLAQARSIDPGFPGFPADFIDAQLAPNLRQILANGVRVVANAGGLSPRACAAAIESMAADQGLSPVVAFVEGDDIRHLADRFRDTGTRDMFTGAAFPPAVDSFNAYLGAFPIARALARGADIVVTGRVVDSALALGPLIHAFGWPADDYDRLAAGTLVGHLLECGSQAVGGTHTDWRDVPNWARMGYPIAECEADGSFVITKPPSSGGLVSVGTVAEQILYEVSDPQTYLVPDVTADFSDVRLMQVGPERLRVSGARGRPPPDSLKASLTWRDGWRGVAMQTLFGIDAVAKAERQAAAVIARSESLIVARGFAPWRRTLVEVLGSETTYGKQGRRRDTREVVLRIVVEHDDKGAVDLFLREQQSTATAGSVGTSLVAGMSAVPVGRLFSARVPRSDIACTITVNGETDAIALAPARASAPPERPAELPLPTDAVQAVPLLALAWVRSGDKGDLFNLGVIAREPAYLPYIAAALTPARVVEWFAHVFRPDCAPRIDRYLVPGFHALNFVLHDSLDGGGQASRRIDAVAKGMGQQLLEIPVRVPAELAARLAPGVAREGCGDPYEAPA